MMLALSCYKRKKRELKNENKREKRTKKEKKKWYIKKKWKRSHKTGEPILDLYSYHQGTWSVDTICVPWPCYSHEKDHVRSSHHCSSSKHHPSMLPVSTLRYAKVMFTNSFTRICLHKNINLIIWIHASFVYVVIL